MKWILIIVLIVIIMLIAFGVSEQYKEKFDFYDNFKSFLNQFKINLNFKQEKIIDFLNKSKGKKQFNLFIQSYQKYLKTNELNLNDIKILTQEEKNKLTQMIQSIGNYDSSNETKQIDSFIIEIEEIKQKAEKDKEKLCPMIIKLSLLFAIGLAILLI